MVRPREFDRDEVLERATRVFWAKGYASTSTDDLLKAMNIGRQSLYNAFGDKRKLYLEALARYQQASNARHLERLESLRLPLDGVEAVLLGLISEDEDERALGCMGVNAICEFGTADPEIAMLRSNVGPRLFKRLAERIREAQACGEVIADIDAREAATFIQMTMQGLQLGARAGADVKSLRTQAKFAIDRIRTRQE